ncbi:MAG: polyprenol monophosphomannose synthase [bacterium]
MNQTSNNLISIVLPTYNERDNIEAVIKKIVKLPLSVEIIVVDDSSPDGTADLVRSLAQSYSVKLISRPGKLGLASAVIKGLNQSSAEKIVVMDADQSHDPAIIPDLANALNQEADIAIGSRFVVGGGIIGWPIRRQAMSWLATRAAKALLGVREKDPLSGYFAVRRDFYQRLKSQLRPQGYKVMLEMLVRGAPVRTKEVGYIFQDRLYGKSKLSWTITREYFLMIWRLLFKKQA